MECGTGTLAWLATPPAPGSTTNSVFSPSARYVAAVSPATADREAVAQVGIPTRGEVQGARGTLKALANES